MGWVESALRLVLGASTASALEVRAFEYTTSTDPAPADDASATKVDVVFLHGLGGSAAETWDGSATPPPRFWPAWLTKDVPGTRTILVDYPTQVTIADPYVAQNADTRAAMIRRTLKNLGVGTRPTIYVCHSLGGITLKRILLDDLEHLNAGENVETREPFRGLLAQSLTTIFFMATPHLGANLANLARFTELDGKDVEGLRHSPFLGELDGLHKSFIKAIDRRRAKGHSIQLVGCAESHTILTQVVVEPSNAYQNMDVEIEMDGDHFGACKFTKGDDDHYKSIRDIIAPIVSAAGPAGTPIEPNRRRMRLDGGRTWSYYVDGTWAATPRDPLPPTRRVLRVSVFAALLACLLTGLVETVGALIPGCQVWPHDPDGGCAGCVEAGIDASNDAGDDAGDDASNDAGDDALNDAGRDAPAACRLVRVIGRGYQPAGSATAPCPSGCQDTTQVDQSAPEHPGCRLVALCRECR